MKNRVVLYLFIFKLCLLGCNKQGEKIYIKNVSSDLLTKVYNTSLDKELREKYTDSLVGFINKMEKDSLISETSFLTAKSYYNLKSLEKYNSLTKQILQASLKLKDSAAIARATSYLGDYYEQISKIDSAFHFYSVAEKYYNLSSNKDNVSLARTKLYKANILYDMGIYTESETLVINALKLLDNSDQSRLKYECYRLLSLILVKIKYFDEAIKYQNIAFNQLNNLKSENYSYVRLVQSEIYNYNSLGYIYNQLGDYSQAQQQYQKGLQKCDEVEYPSLYATLLSNAAKNKMDMKDTVGVYSMLQKSLAIRDSIQNTQGIISSKINLSEYYLLQKDTLKAISFAHSAYLDSKTYQSSFDILQALKILSDNDHDNKKYYSDLYYRVNDSLLELDRATRNKFARIAYETDEVLEQNESLIKRNFLLVNVVVISVFMIIMLFVLYLYNTKIIKLKHKQKEIHTNQKIYNLLLEQYAHAEEAKKTERGRISKELHDGIVNRIYAIRFALSNLDQDVTNKLEPYISELHKTEDQIRSISHDLSLNIHSLKKSFSSMLEDLVLGYNMFNQTIFDFTIDSTIEWSEISNETKINIYRILQESLHNVHKYSQAKRCSVFFFNVNNKIKIQIVDNGVGFDVDKSKKGIGLKNISDRVSQIGGELKINSKINEGTSIEILF